MNQSILNDNNYENNKFCVVCNNIISMDSLELSDNMLFYHGQYCSEQCAMIDNADLYGEFDSKIRTQDRWRKYREYHTTRFGFDD